MGLKEIQGLIFDCQATSADPEKGFLLEMAWTEIQSGQKEDFIASYLIRSGEAVEVPRQVARVTGIAYEDLKAGISEEAAWGWLKASAEKITGAGSLPLCPLIVHYARFEQAYLKDLHHRFNLESPFPFEIFCTHQIAKRLWPELPRKGLRAIAGFLGYSVGEKRRAADHVAATQWIWHQLMEILEKNEGVKTLEDLKHWQNDKPGKSKKKKYPMERIKRLDLPDQPGLYRMLRSNGDLLYVGKATSLKQRVNSYFQKSSAHSEHILEMLSQAVELSYTPTRSALEAALKESDEIKQFSPPYNISLRKRDRQVCFSGRQLNQFSDGCSRRYCLGPLPSPDPVVALTGIIKLINSRTRDYQSDAEMISQVLRVLPEFAAPAACFFEGFPLFMDEHKDLFKGPVDTNGIIHLGTMLWEKRLAEKAEAEKSVQDAEELDEAEEAAEETVREWTPERVARRLNSVVCHGVHLLRRAEWFCRLSESSLGWLKRKGDRERKHLIIFSKADIETALDIFHHIPIPIPPGYKDSSVKRKKNFDIAAYDRLRILTTEIKRLIKERRDPVLCFGPEQILAGDELQSTLRWL